MDDNYIVINGVRYDVIERTTETCIGCAFNFDDGSCFQACETFENILNTTIKFVKQENNN